MKKLIAMAIAGLALSSSTFAGTLTLVVNSNQGQTRASAEEFRYSRSPRDLAGGSASMSAAGAATSGRGAAGGRAAMRRINDPVTIVRALDESSTFFVNAGGTDFIPLHRWFLNLEVYVVFVNDVRLMCVSSDFELSIILSR